MLRGHMMVQRYSGAVLKRCCSSIVAVEGLRPWPENMD